MTLIDYVTAYLVGGVTFLPLVLVIVVYLHPVAEEIKEESSLKAGEIEEAKDSGPGTYKAGWMFVMHEYLESSKDIGTSTQSISDISESKTAYESLYKIAQKDSTTDEQTEPLRPESGNTSSEKSINGEKIRSSLKKHRFYAVLKHGNLFLHKTDRLKDVKHVIVLANNFVTIWPRGLLDVELFSKKSAICVMKKDWSRPRRPSEAPLLEKVSLDDIIARDRDTNPPKGSFYIYCDSNTDMEDWYFALIRATKVDTWDPKYDPNIFAKTLHFETQHMITLIQNLHSSEGQLASRWLNALIGRLFLALYKTKTMENYLKRKLTKKLHKISRPGFLDQYEIELIDSGLSAPLFTYPSLREINPDGTVVVSLYVLYSGKFTVKVKTKANIALAARFKPREVDLNLSICLDRLVGTILLKFKPPPSARIWYTFESLPEMNFSINPVISSRQMSYSIITSQIEKKLKESIKESLVFPFWDDISFYNTYNEIYNGGIWEAAKSESAKSGDSKEILKAEESLDSESKISLTAELYESVPETTQKLKITNTLRELSKRVKKSQPGTSNDSLYSVETGDQSDSNGITEKHKEKAITTLKKIGKWYFKSGVENEDSNSENYIPPEMISNRRVRKATNELDHQFLEDNVSTSPSFDFVKHRSNSILSDLEIGILKTTPTKLPVIPKGTDSYETDFTISEFITKEPPSPIKRSGSKLTRRPPPPPDTALSLNSSSE